MKATLLALLLAVSPATTMGLNLTDSPYLSIISMHEQGSTIGEFQPNIGAYVGRCFSFQYPNRAEGSLLVIQEKDGSDNGPGFPITKKKQFIALYEIDPTYFDDYLGIDRALQERINEVLRLYGEIQFFPSEWQSISESNNDISHLKKNGDNIIVVHTYDDTSKLSEEKQRDLRRNSYKRIYESCYYFKSITNQNSKGGNK